MLLLHTNFSFFSFHSQRFKYHLYTKNSHVYTTHPNSLYKSNPNSQYSPPFKSLMHTSMLILQNWTNNVSFTRLFPSLCHFSVNDSFSCSSKKHEYYPWLWSISVFILVKWAIWHRLCKYAGKLVTKWPGSRDNVSISICLQFTTIIHERTFVTLSYFSLHLLIKSLWLKEPLMGL